MYTQSVAFNVNVARHRRRCVRPCSQAIILTNLSMEGQGAETHLTGPSVKRIGVSPIINVERLHCLLNWCQKLVIYFGNSLCMCLFVSLPLTVLLAALIRPQPANILYTYILYIYIYIYIYI